MWDYFDGLSAGEFWTDFGDVALRAFLSIVVLFILTKLMGNKQISQLNFFDYIIGISIGSIAAEMATTTDRPHHFFVLAMVIYTIITVLITYIARKSIAMRRFFNGTPVPLVENGKIIEKNLVKAGFDVNDLLTELRYAGYFNIEDVQYALEETDGRVSIIPRPSARPATCEDLKITDAKPTLPQSDVIIDGKIMTNNLKSVRKSREWLLEELKKRNKNHKDILLATSDYDGNLTIMDKEVAAKKYDRIRQAIPPVDQDVVMHPLMVQADELVKAHAISRAAEAVCGELQ